MIKFKVTAVFSKVDENGKLSKITHNVLLEAVTFSDAEEQAYKLVEQIADNGFEIKAISRVNIEDVLEGDNPDNYYLVKIAYQSIDDNSGKLKKVKQSILVGTDSVKVADFIVRLETSEWLVPVEIQGISLTNINDVSLQNLPKHVGEQE